ncbi:MAG: Gfo/Idh/MocA family oxidoreductase, partial [Anaerolineae bacterium]|nr:Gfo/Idh/MocA family oxidoreductase [Anaerolineae bacterium]
MSNQKSDRSVRIGIVGCGSVMRGPYTQQIRRIQQLGLPAEVSMTCDVTPEGAQTAQRLWPGAEFVQDYRAVVESSDVDLVLITTAMQMHGEIAKAALLAGKHVLVEKPMSTSLAQAKELVEIAKTSKGILHPAPHVVLSATFKAMKRHIDAGDIGKPYLARAFYGWAGPNWGKWFYQPGGGAVFDLGVYNVASLTGLLGPAKRVTALAGTAIPERVVDGEMTKVQVVDNAHINIDFGNGVYGVVTTGFTIQAYRVPGVEIYGSEGTIQMLGDDWNPKGYELFENKKGFWELHPDLDPNWPWTDGRAPLGRVCS